MVGAKVKVVSKKTVVNSDRYYRNIKSVKPP